MTVKKLLWIIGLINFWQISPLCAQALVQQARQDLAWLCSDSLAGRGFQYLGMQKAAQRLALEYKDAGLEPIGESYFQTFQVEVNLPRSIVFKAGTEPWIPGQDFLVHASSGSIEAQAAYITLDGTAQDWTKQHSKIKGKWVVIEPNDKVKNEELAFTNQIDLAKETQALGLIFIRPKLTHTYSPKQESLPIIECLQSRWHKTKIKKIEASIITELKSYPCANVISISPADIAQYPDSFVIFCAHYDHLGMMGSSIFRGANDNASGTAFLLALARKIKTLSTHYRVVLISFAAEEAGLKGSLYFVKNPLIDLTRVKYVLNFDLMGNGQKGVMAVGAETFPDLYTEIMTQKPNQTPMSDLAKRPNAPNSDHYPFTLKNIPALFFYTMGGPPHYHDVLDVPEGLEFTIFEAFHAWMIQLITRK